MKNDMQKGRLLHLSIMKSLLCLILLAPTVLLRASEIDQLQTQRAVEQFVRKIDKDYRRLELFDSNGRDSSALHNHFFKLDLDSNGLTDLVINGIYVIVIMDRGGHYDLYNLGEIGFEFGGVGPLLGIDSSGKPMRLVVQRTQGYSDVDTLVDFSDAMVEYNPRPDANFTFEGLTVTTNQCFGSCPIFEMRVDADRRAWYHAIRYNKETGEFHGEISAAVYRQLVELLRYLQLDRLDTDYKVDWTDDQTIKVEIRYNGKVKRITDYGEVGTFGLRRLYKLLFAYRSSVRWNK
jgi:hypothetical protein